MGIIINKIKFLMNSWVFTVTIKVWENDLFILKIQSFRSTGCVNINCLFASHNLRTFNLGVNFSFVYSLVFLGRAKVLKGSCTSDVPLYLKWGSFKITAIVPLSVCYIFLFRRRTLNLIESWYFTMCWPSQRRICWLRSLNHSWQFHK